MSELSDLFAQVQKAPAPKIQIDARRLGEPWFVDEATGDVYLMFDEMIVGHNSAVNGIAVHLLFRGAHVHTEPVKGFPGFVEPDAIIHLTELTGKLKVSSMAPSAA